MTDNRECKLVAGPVAMSAQLVLLVVVLTALFLKRQRERPRRPWSIWLLDIGKQACSSGAGHMVGMGIAILASYKSHLLADSANHSLGSSDLISSTSAPSSSGSLDLSFSSNGLDMPGGQAGAASECGWYFVVYFMDCTLGLTLAISFHKLTNGTARYFHLKQYTNHSSTASSSGPTSKSQTHSSTSSSSSTTSSSTTNQSSNSMPTSPSAASSKKDDKDRISQSQQQNHSNTQSHHSHTTSFPSPPPWWEALVEIGNYGDASSPNIRKWGIQVVFWVLCVVTARTVVGCVIISCLPAFAFITRSLDIYFRGHPDAYLYTVMVCIPLVVNVGQAWIQDQVLKWKHKRHHSDKREDEDDSPGCNGTGGGSDQGGGGGISVINMQPLLAPFQGRGKGLVVGGVMNGLLQLGGPSNKTND